ncbi:MAG: hypothetical protein U1F66_04425 [bacterium]
MTPPLSTELSPGRLDCGLCSEPATPPRDAGRAEPPVCRAAPVIAPTPLPPPPPPFRLPAPFSRPWGSILRPSPFVFDTALLRTGETRAAAPARPLTLVDFLPAIASLADHIQALDLDWFNVPVNGGSNLDRYSEYTPRGERPAAPNLVVRSNTRARIHGEVRPIRGTDESLITRMSIDFEPNVWNVVAMNNLEIDGFSIVDPPTIRYDRRFLTRSSVTEIDGRGDFSYENPLGGSGPLATPFDSEAAPPPHRDWMFRFSPVTTTALAVLQEGVANGDTLLRFGYGALMLWAFFPTLGLTDEGHYSRLGIRYNTFPRRLGDIVRIFSPLFDREQNLRLREAAPFLNPNSEYLLDPSELRSANEARCLEGHLLPEARCHDLPSDPIELLHLNNEIRSQLGSALRPGLRLLLEGLRQPIPTNRAEVEALNLRRRELNAARARDGLPALPEISANRGPVLDWFSTTLARDPVRLAAIPDSELPHVDFHARLRAGSIPLPVGELNLGADTELRGRYFLERVSNPGPGESSVRLAIDLTVEPLDLGRMSFAERGVALAADSLHVNRGVVELRFPVMLDAAARAPGPSIHFRLEGVRAQNLDLNAEEAGLHAVLPQAQIGSIEFTRSAGREWTLALNTLSGDDIHVEHPALHLTLGHLDIPELTVRRSYSESGEPGELVIRGPGLGIEGIHTDGRIPIRDGSFHLNDGEMSLRQGSMTFEGNIDLRASLPNGFSEGPTVFGNFTISPDIRDLHVGGRAHFEFFRGGWSLRRAEGAAPLNIGFRIAESWLTHCPGTLPGFLDHLPAAAIIQTRVQLSEAQVQVDDLQSVEYRQLDGEEGPRGQIRELHSGPITVHHVRGGGSIWVGLPIWGFVRGLFPNLGGTATGRERRPDMAPLVAHLPQSVRDLLGDGDFLRIGGVDLSRTSGGDWRTQLDDLILNIHETGGRGQFGGIRVPRLVLEGRSDEAGRRRTTVELDPFYWANIYLNDPDRGGSFRFVRWMTRTGR